LKSGQKYKRILIVFLVGIIFSTSMVFADEKTLAMDDVITYQHVNYSVPSIAISIVQDGEVIYQNISGQSDLEKNLPLTAEKTAIQTGSVGKLITTLGLLQLMDKKDIPIDTLVSDYLIDDYVPEATLTFGDLLKHTTGIPALKADIALKESPFEEGISFASYADTFMRRYAHKAVMPSGEYTIYSNVGSIMAGLLIEALSNESYEAYISEAVLKPMGLYSSADLMLHKRLSAFELASGYHVFGGERQLMEPFQTKLIASEDFVTTVSDMTSILQSLTTLSTDSLLYEQLFTRYVSAYDAILGRSLGFSIKKDGGYELFLQDGGVPGETTRLFFMPGLKLGVFIWYNSDATALRDDLTDEILSIYASSVKPEVPAVVQMTETADYSGFIGAYAPVNVSRETIERVTKIIHQVRLSDNNGKLMIDKKIYEPIGNDVYYNEVSDNYVRFVVDSAGKETYLVIDNTFYQHASLLESLYFDIPVLFLVAFFNMMALILILLRWDKLLVNRIHTTPRFVLLLETLFSTMSIVLVMVIGVRYNAWAVAYHVNSATLWLKISGIMTAILLVPSLMMLSRGKADFRWRGGTVFIFRMLLIFNLLMVLWLWYYNFI